MKKYQYALPIFLLIFIFSLGWSAMVKAKTTFLIIPSQFWTEASTNYSEWQPTQVIPFADYAKHDGRMICSQASRSIHKADFSPSYSFCSTKKPDYRIWSH